MTKINKLFLFLFLIFTFISSGIVAQTHQLNLEAEKYQNNKFDITKMTNTNNSKGGANDVIITDNAFLQGQFVEVGIAECGCFGTTATQPAGYHGNVGSNLGFVADPDKDGWTTGDPAYNGDFFLPGSPEEGFGVEMSGANYGNYGKCGTNQIPMTATSILYEDDTHKAIWKGAIAGLDIKNTVFFHDTALYFMIKAELTNTTGATLTDVYYMRNVDPDNEKSWTGSYSTENSVVFQPTDNSCKKALVTAVGETYGMYLGLGAADDRARVTHGGFSNRSASDIYNGVGLNQSGTAVDDAAISISFFIGDIPAGETAVVIYAYILDEAQLDAAMSQMIRLTANGNDITNTLIHSACAGNPIDLEIENGDAYSWTWSPNIALNTNIGAQIVASPIEDITYTASGTSDCASLLEYTFQIVVSDDTENPVISDCPSNQTFEPNVGICGYFISDNSLDPSATDNCYLKSFEHDFNGGGTTLNTVEFPAGTTTVTWVAEDGKGNISTCIYTITINGTDTQAPVVNCQNITLSLEADGTLILDGTEIDNGSTDNCGISSHSALPNNFDCSDLGENIVTLTVMDGMGNSSSCDAVVTIVDDAAPVPVINNITVELDENGLATISTEDVDAGTWDNCGLASMEIDVTEFSCDNVGSQAISFTATDVNGNVAIDIAYVTVEDNTFPVISSDITLSINGAYTLVAEDVASDNCSFSVTFTSGQTSYDCIDIGNVYVVTVQADDASGNSSTVDVNVTIVDDITLDKLVLSDILAECSVDLSTQIPTATTNCAGTPINGTTPQMVFDTQGTYTITWTFDDNNGSVKTQVQNIIINDVTNPETPILSDVTGECSATATAPTTTDNCAGTVTGTSSDVLTYNMQGTYIITWNFDDGNGNNIDVTQNIIINDVTNPETPILADVTGECSATATIPTTTDNCAGTITGTTIDALIYTTQGTHVITWNFDDGNGNNIDVTQNVIINDVTNPVPDITNLPDVNVECEVKLEKPTAKDNCAGIILATTTDPTLYTEQGRYIIHWVYNDGNGNISEQIQNVNIEDVTNPVIYCIEDKTINLENGQTVYTVIGDEFDPVSVSDNCNIKSIINDFNSLSTLNGVTFAIGTTNVTWTIEDIAGNISTCSFNIIVNKYINIASLKQNGIYIYPNPTDGEIKIKSISKNIQNIKISNAIGEILINKDNIGLKENVDLSNLPNGIYFIRIKTEKQTFLTKIIKK